MIDKIDPISYGTSASVGLYGYLTAQNLGIAIGAICAIVTAAASVWAKVREVRRNDRLAARELERQ